MITSYRALTATVCAAALALPATACAGTGQDKSTRADTQAQARAIASAAPTPSPSTAAVRPFRKVPTVAQCRTALRVTCYTPDLVRTAYGIDKLNAAGLTGKGRTVVVYEQVVPTTLKKDLETFSKTMKLPAPDVTVDAYDPAGHIARFDPKNPQMARPAIETTLDVQMVHMAAPDAKIVVTEIGLPTSAYSTVHPSGTPEPVPEQEAGQEAAESAAAGAELVLDGIAESVRKHKPDAISVSFGIEEYTAAGSTRQPAGDLAEFSTALAAVTAAGTTLVASAGDSGAAPPIGPNNTRVKSVSWPASDPNVLSLGASRLHLDDTGKRTAPDTVWHDQVGATGGGPSQTFTRPTYQNAVKNTVGTSRGTSDISLDGSASGGTLIHQSFLPAGEGWMPVGGTSEAAPMFAAIVALANQKAGTRLGAIHEELYQLAATSDGGIIDITQGDNGPDGYPATKGYDLASGLGTLDASTFVPALARLATTNTP